jgi:type IV secretion system protein VirD4
MVVAGTRAGKGVACIIPAIIDHAGPVVVIDIKGENFAVCRRHRASLGRRQIVLNPFHVIEDATSHYDPLTYLRPDHLQRDIATLCDGLIKPEGAAESGWISNAAREILEAAVELVMVTGGDAERSLLTVTDLVLAPNRLETFAAWMEAGNLCNGRIARAGAKITQMGDRQQGAILDCLADNLAWMKFDQVRAMLGACEFQIDELLDDKIDLYLVVPQDMTQKLSNFMRLMMTLAMGAVTRQDGRRQVTAKILAVLDEFTRLGRMEKVMEIATIAAAGGIEAVFVVQDRGTLDHIYTPDGANTLLGSCATTRIFGLGRADNKTAKWAEEALTNKTVIRESRTHRQAKKDTSRSETKERLMDGPAIQEMPAKQMLCLIRANAPLLLDQIISHKHPAYRDKLDPNPVARA